MKITREEVLRVAELAHLELSEAEVELYRWQLDSILGYVEKLNQLDTASVEPMAGGHPLEDSSLLSTILTGKLSSSLREDAPRSTPPIEPAAALRVAPDPAPAASGAGGPGVFRVPKVIDR
jgi:aspartyl-tRNA(Asn)/glutamyl-tRNA(Gln) amidotransferase subunit C